MSFRSVGLALLSGIAVFLVVGAAVAGFMRSYIEFSLLLGIPAGLASGAFTAAAVYLGSADDTPVGRRRIAGAFAAFGLSFSVLLVVLGGIVATGMLTAILSSIVVALAVAVVAYLRGPSEIRDTVGDDSDTQRRPN